MIPDRTGPLQRLHVERIASRDEEPKPNGHRRGGVPRSDAQVIELCRRAKNAPKFERLYDRGDISEYDGDDSRADLALIDPMAFYTQDREQLDRLFRGSALYRPEKWGKRSDYRWRTIETALSSRTETYTLPRTERVAPAPPSPLPIKGDGSGGDKQGAPVVWLSELGTPQVREFLVGDAVPRNHPTVIHGWSGTGKSILALLMAMAVSGKWEEWLGLPVHAHGKVLYLDFELDADEQLRRVHALASGLGVAVPEDLAYLSALGLHTPEAFRYALDICRTHDIVMVVIDSFGPAMLGDMEAAKDVIKFHNDYIAPLRAIGTTPLIIDHQGKLQSGENYQQKTAFGSAYKEHLARSVLQVEAGDRDRDSGTLNVRVRHKKSNFAARLEPFDVRLLFEGEKYTATTVELDDADLATEATLNSKDRVVRALKAGPAFPDELAEMTGLALGTVVNCVTQLKRSGRVETTGELKGRAQQVRLTPSPSVYKSSGDGGDITAEQVVAEFNRRSAGARLNLPKYLRSETTLEILTKSVLVGLNRDMSGWEKYAAMVEEIARDASNHSVECNCPECI